MDFKEFHNLKGIKDKDNEPGDKGVFIQEGQNIAKDINLGQTRQEIKNSLASILPGLDEPTLEELTNTAMEQNIQKDQLNDFAKKSSSGLKLESMDTSAVTVEKTQDTKDDSFIPKVETPTVPTNNDTKVKNEDLANEGPEI